MTAEFRIYRNVTKANGNTDSRELVAYANVKDAEAMAALLNRFADREPRPAGYSATISYVVHLFQL